MSPIPSITFRSELDPVVRKELDQYDSELTEYVLQEHDDDGRHTNISATSLAVVGPITAGGVVSGATLISKGGVYERGRTPAMGEWIDYPMVVTASGAAPSLGNSTVVSRYAILGRTVCLDLFLSWGSTSVFGSGDYTFSLPSGLPARFVVRGFMPGWLLTFNAAPVGRPVTALLADASHFWLRDLATNTTYSTTFPAVPGVSDQFSVRGFYELG